MSPSLPVPTNTRSRQPRCRPPRPRRCCGLRARSRMPPGRGLGAGGASSRRRCRRGDARPAHRARDVFAALLSWIDGIGETGLDGHDLKELGLKNGNLTVDDQRTGKHWSFRDINLSAARLHGGGVEVSVGSSNPTRPWVLTAAATPTRQGYRRVQLQAHRVPIGELLLMSRLDDGNLRIDTPLSATMNGEIGPDGLPQNLVAHVVAEAGSIGEADDDDSRIPIERAEVKFNWDAENRLLSVPFQVISGGNRITLLGQIEAPQEAAGTWLFKIGGGTIVLNTAGTSGRALGAQSHRHRRPLRRGQAAFRGRRRRYRQYQRRHSHVGQPGSCRRQSSADGRHGRHAHAGRCDEAPVAGLHHAESARLVQRAPSERHARAHRHCGELADSRISKTAGRRFPTTAFRSTLRRSVASSGRSTACRRCAMPT